MVTKPGTSLRALAEYDLPVVLYRNQSIVSEIPRLFESGRASVVQVSRPAIRGTFSGKLSGDILKGCADL